MSNLATKTDMRARSPSRAAADQMGDRGRCRRGAGRGRHDLDGDANPAARTSLATPQSHPVSMRAALFAANGLDQHIGIADLLLLRREAPSARQRWRRRYIAAAMISTLDTHELVKDLKASGFTDAQAEAVTRAVRLARISTFRT